MLLAELRRVEPDLMPVLQRRAAGWCLDNGMPEEALEYSMAAGDVGAVAGLVEQLWLPAHWQGRLTTLQRWFGWLEDRGGIEGHPIVAVLASLLSVLTGRPAEAERWADAVDRWQYGDPARPGDPSAEAWAAVLRALLCRGGAGQMRADADEAVRRFAEESFVTPAPATAATRPSRRRSASGRKLARTRLSRPRCANDHCWRWHATNGARPRTWPARHAPFCAGPGSRKATPPS
jgi:LuxR family maltose regulon positive regulatory protein